MKRIAAYPGSFDPLTLGHLDILTRVSPLFDEIYVLVSHSVEKKYLFSIDERVNLAQQAVAHLKNVVVVSNMGLTVDKANQVGAQVLIRGVRSVSDFDQEMAMANINRKISKQMETMVVFSDPDKACISSRFVKEISKNNGEISHFVPDFIAHQITLKTKG